MDIARPDLKRRKQRRRWIIIVSVIATLVLTTAALSRLSPAAPSVERAQVWLDTVQRGEMLRQVRGNGSLVPERIQHVQSDTDGRIERILLLPGGLVEPDTILMELSNPELKQAVFDLEWRLKGAEASMRRLEIQLQSERLTQESLLTTLRSELHMADLAAEADASLAESGLVPSLTVRQSQAKAEELKGRLEIEGRRLDIREDSDSAQIAVQESELAQLRASLALKKQQLEALNVRAGSHGVLQQIGDATMLQVGQRIAAGATLAKIVQPELLMARIKIAETQARDVQIGQIASIDTRNGIIPGTVLRVDPSVLNGTVTVDIGLEGPLPRGARPDLSVDGTIELERLSNVLHVGRPVHAQSDATIGLFKVGSDGEAIRVPVKLGRNSVSTIEIIEGLQEGDEVILSDMSQWDAYSRIRLR